MIRSRACARVNPALWESFLERRRLLNEPEPDPNDWTSPAVAAWMDVRKYRAPPVRDYSNSL